MAILSQVNLAFDILESLDFIKIHLIMTFRFHFTCNINHNLLVNILS